MGSMGPLVFAGALLALVASSSTAYELRLDIDLDDDPSTLNDFSLDEMVDVRIVMMPSTPGEVITTFNGGLGGPCVDCPPPWDEAHYGVEWIYGPMEDTPFDFVGFGAYGLLNCHDDLSFNEYVEGYSADGVVLDGPIFIASLRLWIQTPPDGCPVLPPIFMLREDDGTIWSVEIGGGAVPLDEVGWAQLKARFRR